MITFLETFLAVYRLDYVFDVGLNFMYNLTLFLLDEGKTGKMGKLWEVSDWLHWY